ncbi:MAG: hypothetical protein A2204_05665 [Elusimicrobia bacterium RIFOXYA1_FULL_47_7]|nr:MAG: hypothetical protein A2278_05405 [Elusimicrobia bacterium RIFOXYA12_FULL_49_49]OGS09750.1 MAG: hypothetical protein A2204_05665 [Elusimicrobia bacterium RIFOXYA1_FULL_47_7]OGS10773.1 MAG: hypothetical protein A2386_05140 [Elusimicrobia bacterium RIFOXYB1_FULL_48_9]OGS16487.1 MAG: hypothetical protein A2251_06655 [Elusimicrobia bacterium RIFOXYA2_FULL_47_53]OGS26659.1 MAG: hypothetical protein A2339_01770 [Elusimicrobia bacterium RIFOXYB12_FULL_50_12]OGS31224.1 MAG: hypothetical protein
MALVFAGNILDAIKKQLGLDEKIHVIMQAWEKELGAMSKDAELVAVHKGTLLVEVASSAHFQELSLRKRELINKLNQYFGKEKFVKAIKIKLKT